MVLPKEYENIVHRTCHEQRGSGTGRPEQEIARNGEDSQAEILRSHITPRLTRKRHYAGNDARPPKTRRAAQAVDR